MAGDSADEIVPRLQALPIDDRQRLLCAVCSIRDEITCTCRNTGAEVSKLLSLQCPFFVDGQVTCLLDTSTGGNGTQCTPLPQNPANATKGEQRREHRFKPNQTAAITVLGLRPGPITQACVLDISGSGMRLRTRLPIPCGARIEIEVNDTVATGSVCRCEPQQGSYEIGVQVSETAPRFLKQ